MNAWRQKAVDTNEKHLRSATDWLSALEPEASCQINTANALLKAMEDTMVRSFSLPI